MVWGRVLGFSPWSPLAWLDREDQLIERTQDRDGDAGRVRQDGPAARRRVEHPLRHVEWPRDVGAIEHAAKHCVLRLRQDSENERRTAVPRMPAIENHSRLGTMGVSLSSCTRAIAVISRWTRTLRRCDRCRDGPVRELGWSRIAGWAASITATPGETLRKDGQNTSAADSPSWHIPLEGPGTCICVAPNGDLPGTRSQETVFTPVGQGV